MTTFTGPRFLSVYGVGTVVCLAQSHICFVTGTLFSSDTLRMLWLPIRDNMERCCFVYYPTIDRNYCASLSEFSEPLDSVYLAR